MSITLHVYKYLEYFNGVFTTGLASHMHFFLSYLQPRVKLGDASGLIRSRETFR